MKINHVRISDKSIYSYNFYLAFQSGLLIFGSKSFPWSFLFEILTKNNYYEKDLHFDRYVGDHGVYI
jgi:hypothetical protein